MSEADDITVLSREQWQRRKREMEAFKVLGIDPALTMAEYERIMAPLRKRGLESGRGGEDLLTGERIALRQSRDGLTADYAENLRPHQSTVPVPVGVTTWRLGTKSQFVVLSAADIAQIYTPVNSFGSAVDFGDSSGDGAAGAADRSSTG